MMIKISANFFSILFNDPSRHADDSRMMWHVFENDRSRSHLVAFTYRNRTQHCCACRYQSIVHDGWMTLPFFMPSSSEGHALKHCDIMTDFTRLTYAYTHTMIDEKPSADLCTWMNFNACEKTADLGYNTCDES